MKTLDLSEAIMDFVKKLHRDGAGYSLPYLTRTIKNAVEHLETCGHTEDDKFLNFVYPLLEQGFSGTYIISATKSATEHLESLK